MKVSGLYNKFLFCLCTRCYLRKTFKFLIDFNYKETIDEKLVLKEWRDGISYSNGKKVVIFTFDNREKRFVTIFYEIQKDFRIPNHDGNKFFTLDGFLTKDQKIINAIENTYYDLHGKIGVINMAAMYIKKYSDYLL